MVRLSIWHACLAALPLASALTVPQQTISNDILDDLAAQNLSVEDFNPVANEATDISIQNGDISVLNEWEPKEWDYDVIIVGGGPAGLAAMNSLGRVGRKALLYDSKEYRNIKTRYMHDVLGNDGTRPVDFRGKVRGDINSLYGDTSFFEMQGKKVSSITPVIGGFRVRDDKGSENTAKKVILATGVTDVIPDKPGFKDAFGRGMFWCMWCDGHDYKNRKVVIYGPIHSAIGSALSFRKLTTDLTIMTGGPISAEDKKKAEEKWPGWEKLMKDTYKVQILDVDITEVVRTGASDEPRDDKYQVKTTRGVYEANGILIQVPTKQTSHLPQQLHLKTTSDRKIEVSSSMESSIAGIFAVGDANNDGSTNAYHAMWSAKRAAVNIHVALSREEYFENVPSAFGSAYGFDADHERQIQDLEYEIGFDVETAYQAYGEAF